MIDKIKIKIRYWILKQVKVEKKEVRTYSLKCY